jgi:hypothetical protein
MSANHGPEFFSLYSSGSDLTKTLPPTVPLMLAYFSCMSMSLYMYPPYH